MGTFAWPECEPARQSCRVLVCITAEKRGTAKLPTKMLQNGLVVKQLARLKCQTSHNPSRNDMHLHPAASYCQMRKRQERDSNKE